MTKSILYQSARQMEWKSIVLSVLRAFVTTLDFDNKELHRTVITQDCGNTGL